MSTTVLTDYGPPSPTESWTVADIKAMIERKEPFWAQPLRWPTPATISIIAWLSPTWTNGQVDQSAPANAGTKHLALALSFIPDLPWTRLLGIWGRARLSLLWLCVDTVRATFPGLGAGEL